MNNNTRPFFNVQELTAIMLVKIKHALFMLLDKWLNPTADDATIPQANSSAKQKPYYWCFCSTIGELNACKPLISKVPEQYQLVLLTDRDVYQQSYLRHFSEAIVITLKGSVAQNKQLINALPPCQVLVCEIPLRLHDAPCRLSFDLLYRAKQSGAIINLVNGWLYHYPPSCRQDGIERQLFDKDYLALFDVITVQTEHVKQEILPLIDDPQKITVTGNMKFDALTDTSFTVKDQLSQQLLTLYQQSQDKIWVAGCVSEPWEYDLVLDTYQHARLHQPDLKLIMVPRHPENTEHMDYIQQKLADSSNYQWRTELQQLPAVLPDILVLNTVGELKAFYSVADICYVGRNHNILEPMAFNKPIVVFEGWEKTYPSFPVYQAVSLLGAIYEIKTKSELTDWFVAEKTIDMKQSKLSELTGATYRNSQRLGLKNNS